MHDRDKTPLSSNSLLFDINTFVSADLLLRPIHAPPIWDNVHCYSNILESVILADELVVPLPEKSRFSDLPMVSALSKEGLLRVLDADSEPVSAVRKALPASLPVETLPRLADWVCKNHHHLTRFEHFFPVTACNTWMDFDGSLHVPSIEDSNSENFETMLWGDAWAESHGNMVQHLPWGFQRGRVRMPDLAMSFLLRGYVYTDLAVHLRISYNAHPYRAPLLTAETLECAGLLPSLADLSTRWINSLRGELLGFSKSNSVEPYFELSMPSLFACILKECKTIEDATRVALGMRNSKSAEGYRECARAVMDDLRANKTTKLRELSRDLDDLASRMRKELGAEVVSANVSLWLFSFSARVPRFLHKAIWNGPHLRLLYDTVAKATEIAGLKGELKRLGIDPHDGLPY